MTRTRAIAFFLDAAVNGEGDRRQRRDGEPPLTPHKTSGNEHNRTEARAERG